MSDKEDIIEVLKGVEEVLLEKNKRYGESATHPLGIFSKHVEVGRVASNGILVRLDDKLNRIKNGSELRKNDIFDIIGYLILLCVVKGWKKFTEFLD